jgi:hypothetical protein
MAFMDDRPGHRFTAEFLRLQLGLPPHQNQLVREALNRLLNRNIVRATIGKCGFCMNQAWWWQPIRRS